MKAGVVLAVLAFTASNVAADPWFRYNPKDRWWRYYTSCGFRGMSCARDVTPEANPEAHNARLQSLACHPPGNSCHKAKRTALAVADAVAEPWFRYNKNDRWWRYYTSCGFPGASCAKARRDLTQIADLTKDILDKALSVDDDEVALTRRDAVVPNLPTTEKTADSHAPEGEEHEFSDEEIAKHIAECFADGGECNTIQNAHNAFKGISKREPWFRYNPKDRWWRYYTSCGFRGMSCARDVAEVDKKKEAGDPEVLKAIEDCKGPDGECTKADEHLKQLEELLEQAVNADYV